MTSFAIPDRVRPFLSAETALIDQRLGFRPADLRVADGRRFLFLCFTNRCGSTYFAGLMHTTGALAYAGEVMSAGVVLQRAAAERLACFEQYFSTLPVQHGWVASKLGIGQLLMLAECGILDRIRDRSHFILLERRDKVAQAASRVIAFHRGSWTSSEATAAPAPAYARAALQDNIAIINAEMLAFRSFFSANGIVPLSLTHEHVVADPYGAVAMVGRFLAVRGLAAQPDAIGMRPQADAINAVWRARFLAGG